MLTDNILKTPVLCSRSPVETVHVLYCFASLCCSRFSNPNPSTGMSRILQSAWNNTAPMENSVTAEYIEQHRDLAWSLQKLGASLYFVVWPLLTQLLLSGGFKLRALQLPVHLCLLSGSLSQHHPALMIWYCSFSVFPEAVPFQTDPLLRPC